MQLTFDTLALTSLPPVLAAQIAIDPVSGCWVWTGRLDRDGYGRIGDRGAHRTVWLVLHGPIESGLQLDHLCHDPAVCRLSTRCPHRRCVNPDHLAPATAAANSLRSNSFAAVNARKTRCDHDHEYDAANTYRRPDGHRDCRACIRRRVREYKARLRQADLARAA